jgi:hypothetical protein
MITTHVVWRCLGIVLLLVSMVAAPVMADPGKDEAHGKEGKGKHEKHRPKSKDRESRGYDGYFHEHGYTTLGIPQVICPRPANAASGIPTGRQVTNRPQRAVGACVRMRLLAAGLSTGPSTNLTTWMSPCMMRIGPASSSPSASLTWIPGPSCASSDHDNLWLATERGVTAAFLHTTVSTAPPRPTHASARNSITSPCQNGKQDNLQTESLPSSLLA